jgi:hypothetical protein
MSESLRGKSARCPRCMTMSTIPAKTTVVATVKVVCPSCSAVGEAPNRPASPKPLRCRKCGTRFQPKPADPIATAGTPAVDDGYESQEQPIDVPIEVGENLNIIVAEEPTGLISAPNSPSREPWFYWFLEGWGKFYLFAALLSAALMLLMFVYVVLFALATSKDLQTAIPDVFKMTAGYALLLVLFVLPFLLMYLTLSALIFILVDQARNIRQIRLNFDERRTP